MNKCDYNYISFFTACQQLFKHNFRDSKKNNTTVEKQRLLCCIFNKLFTCVKQKTPHTV